MYIHDFFQNFLKIFLVCFHGAFPSSVIAPDIPPRTSSMYVVLFSETYQRAIQIYCRQMFDDIPFQMLSEMEIAAVLLSYIQSIF